jgi:DNA-binding NarL/FixJ family response regulator
VVAVCDPLPLFRLGVARALESSGFQTECPDAPEEWLHGTQDGLLLLTVKSNDDWVLLRRLGQEHRPRILVAVLEEEATDTSYVDAILAGADSALSRGSSAEQLSGAVGIVAQGFAVVPHAVLRALAARPAGSADHASDETPSEDELNWLRALAQGAPIRIIAENSGHSERTMYRLLRTLYRRLNARTRFEALLIAKERGLV